MPFAVLAALTPDRFAAAGGVRAAASARLLPLPRRAGRVRADGGQRQHHGGEEKGPRVVGEARVHEGYDSRLHLLRRRDSSSRLVSACVHLNIVPDGDHLRHGSS